MGSLKNPSPQTIPFESKIFGIFPIAANRVAGLYYGILATGYSANAAMTAGRLMASPFIVYNTETFDRIAINVGTGSAGNARLGIYRDNGSIAPGALVLDAGEIDTTATGDKELTIDQELTPGLYWLVLNCAATPSVMTFSQTNFLGLNASIASGGIAAGYRTVAAYDVLPATHPTATAWAGGIPAIVLRRA